MMVQEPAQDAQCQIEGLHYRTGSPVRIRMICGKIVAIEELAQDEYTSGLPWVAPGLVDLQINGCFGIDFNTPPIGERAIHDATRQLWVNGVTTYYPTVITNSDDAIEEMVAAIARACRNDGMVNASIAGIHLEGPFISPLDGPRGAHDQAYVKAPDWALFLRWQQAADGLIRLVTLSPEWEGATDFISRCVESGVMVSIGHTAASPEQIARAVQAGAALSTHLGNGAHLTLPRHPNYIWEQLAQDQLFATVIGDGFHLPASVLKVFYQVKKERMLLVSDAVYLSGLAPGDYETHIGGRVTLTEEGRLHLTGNQQLLAGSAQLLRTGVSHMSRTGVCSRSAAWDMASVHPAHFMRLPTAQGLAVGAPADLLIYSWGEEGQIRIHDVYKEGNHVVESNVISSSSQA